MSADRKPGSRYRVLHVISGLNTGGAEKILVRLARGLGQRDVENTVISLKHSGSIITEELAELQVPVHPAFVGGGLAGAIGGVARLMRAAREARADVVQGWMYHGDLAAWLVRSTVARRAPLVWSIHHTLTHLAGEKLTARASIALGRRLSASPVAIQYVSHSSAAQHATLGYRSERACVIPNACDTAKFQRDPEAAVSLRRELGLPEDVRLIGHIAGRRPMKDHETLLAAARVLIRERGAPNCHFVLVGPGVTATDTGLARPLADCGVAEHIHCLGERSDTVRLMSAFDLATLSSAWGESCPTVILEAMACETPCVVTDVGDAARLVDRFGRVVAPRDPGALAQAYGEMLALGPAELRSLGEQARDRVRQCYEMDAMVERFDELYLEALGRPRETSGQRKTPEP